MTLRENPPVGAPCWVDLSTSDTERAAAFYSEIFGWIAGAPAPEFGGYFSFARHGVLMAGCMPKMADNPGPDTWTTYLASADARATLAAVEAHGGQVFVPAMDVADLGTMALAVDSGGAMVGVWEPKVHRGFGEYGVAGTPVWFDLMTRDYDDAVAFYRDVFVWDTHVLSDTPQFHYTTLQVGDEQLAGIMDATRFLPDGVPAHWLVCFGVTDTDASLARIVELGGAIIIPAEDTPYGRIATVSDPTGAIFRIISV